MHSHLPYTTFSRDLWGTLALFHCFELFAQLDVFADGSYVTCHHRLFKNNNKNVLTHSRKPSTSWRKRLLPRKKHTNRVAQHFKSKWTSSSSSSYQGDQRLQLYPWKLSRFQRVPERTNNTFLRYNMNPADEYMTPPSAWETTQKYIPKNKVIWEAFYGGEKWGDNPNLGGG